jgi:hypothetical protein
MAERLVTIATFSQPTEAHIFKGRLEAEGIPCFLGDEHIIAAQPFYSVAVGGVKLRVTESDEQEAREMLARIQGGSSEYILDDYIVLAPPMQEPTQANVCPNCGSDLIGEEQLSRAASFFSWLLSSLQLFISRRYTCYDCDYCWKR